MIVRRKRKVVKSDQSAFWVAVGILAGCVVLFAGFNAMPEHKFVHKKAEVLLYVPEIEPRRLPRALPERTQVKDVSPTTRAQTAVPAYPPPFWAVPSTPDGPEQAPVSNPQADRKGTATAPVAPERNSNDDAMKAIDKSFIESMKPYSRPAKLEETEGVRLPEKVKN